MFSPMIRYWNGSRRVEYVCRGYHRNGKGYCASHRIHEEILDKAVWDDTEKLREQYAAELKKVTQLQKTVGIEETSSRCPLFDFAERNFEIGAGG